MRRLSVIGSALLLALLLSLPQPASAQDATQEKPFKQEELDQMLAPLALYPDSLIAQILMASTYPMEVVQAARWAKENEKLEGEALVAALEKQPWDPSVKSLVNFPQVLGMMDEKLDWTQKLGDAFLAQQKEVMDTIQKLRKKAKEQGNLETTKEQKVIVEKETQTIVIESADPKVVYVPTYNPTVVYGPWWYPSYPPYYYYPPAYVPGAGLFWFGVGCAVGGAWGYAWGGCNWHNGDVDIDVNRNNLNIGNIDRGNYSNRITNGQGGRGSWKHDSQHRQGAPYRDQATAKQYDRGAARDAQSRDAFRGKAEAGRQDIAKGGADQFKGRTSASTRDVQGRGDAARGDAARGSAGRADAGSRGKSATQQPRSSASGSRSSSGSAFGGYDGGSRTKSSSSRGRESISSSRSSGGMSHSSSMSRSSGFSGSRGGGFSGGGMSRGGGGRGGGGRR